MKPPLNHNRRRAASISDNIFKIYETASTQSQKPPALSLLPLITPLPFPAFSPSRLRLSPCPWHPRQPWRQAAAPPPPYGRSPPPRKVGSGRPAVPEAEWGHAEAGGIGRGVKANGGDSRPPVMALQRPDGSDGRAGGWRRADIWRGVGSDHDVLVCGTGAIGQGQGDARETRAILACPCVV